MTDWLNNRENPSAFTAAIITMALISIGSAVTEFLCDAIYNVTMSRIHTRIQSNVFRSVLHQDIGFFDAVHTGDITSRITTDTNTMSEALSDRLSLLLWYLMRTLCLFGFMLSLSGRLSLFTAIGIPIILLIPDLAGGFYQALSAEVQTSLAAASQVAMETFSAMRTVKSLAGEESETRRYRHRLQLSFQLNQKEAAAYAGFMCLTNVGHSPSLPPSLCVCVCLCTLS
uniref:Antigen peptide transporter 1-like n=1 Tax=Callorhinchus milii TaxID=7868 RepID=A0A4W3H4X8_CALMI